MGMKGLGTKGSALDKPVIIRFYEDPKHCFGIYWSRHHSWCCVKGRLHAAARQRRAKKYCDCGKGCRQFRRPKWLMFRKRRMYHRGCAPCSGSHKCCHDQDTSPELKDKFHPSKSILLTHQVPPSSELRECACTKEQNCGDKMIQQVAMQNLCRFTVDAYFT